MDLKMFSPETAQRRCFCPDQWTRRRHKPREGGEQARHLQALLGLEELFTLAKQESMVLYLIVCERTVLDISWQCIQT